MADSSNKKFNPNLEAEVLDRRTDELEKRVKTVVQYYENNEELTDGANDESAQSKRMQDLMQRFHLILCKIMNHKWAFPFNKPVDAEALELYDYHEVIKKPMDLGTILNRMEAKEESRSYKNVYDICSDVRLVFTNAMTYNDPGSHVHIMAQKLSSVFEELWYPLSLKVAAKDRRQEAAIDKLARDTEEELTELSMQLKELREELKKRCRHRQPEKRMHPFLSFVGGLGCGRGTLARTSASPALSRALCSDSRGVGERRNSRSGFLWRGQGWRRAEGHEGRAGSCSLTYQCHTGRAG
ncbi:transcription factor GTE1-like protein [Carex littledalei]|uniref:Transcription factor GTE1-like protein n=1 Tax=Carex littledalei TaxID=544730 RepID=A0A833QZ92_9POAL|nr:transcription factor GTE1-like protein [Carex littledalei]